MIKMFNNLFIKNPYYLINQKVGTINMNSIHRLTIAAILRSAEKQKASTLPKSSLLQIQKLIKSQNKRIQHYEILKIYHYFSYHKDTVAFKRIDELLFSRRNQPHFQVSFQLAYRRLYCLVLYQMPYSRWIKKLRQLMHETKLTATDFKNLIHLRKFDILRTDQGFKEFYEDYIGLFEQQIEKIDQMTLIALRRYYGKISLFSERAQAVQQIMTTKIIQNLQNFSSEQLKFNFVTKKCRQLMHVSSLRKYAFYLLFYNSKKDWAIWANNKFTRKQILQKIPQTLKQPKPILIIQNLLANYMVDKPYIDQFFQLIVQQKDGIKRTRLKRPQKEMNAFLLNALFFLFSNSQNISPQILKSINDVITQTNYITKDCSYIFIYLAIRQTIILYSNLPLQTKIQAQTKLIKQVHQLLKMPTLATQNTLIQKFYTLQFKSYKILCLFEHEVYKIPQLKFVVQKLIDFSNYAYSNFLLNKYSQQLMQIQKIINAYVTCDRPQKNHFFFDEYIQYYSKQPNIQINIAHRIQINHILSVSYLIKITNIETKKQVQYLLDFSKIKYDQHKKQLLRSKQWKINYLVKWCNLLYEIENYMPWEDYFQTDNFKRYQQMVIQ